MMAENVNLSAPLPTSAYATGLALANVAGGQVRDDLSNVDADAYGARFLLRVAAGTVTHSQWKAGLVDIKPVNTRKELATSAPNVRISAAAQQLAYQQYIKNIESSPAQIAALDVNTVVKESPAIGKSGVGYYAEYLRSYENENKNNPNGYSFVGSYGPDKVTTDLDEYIGWLYEAAGKQARIQNM